MNNTNAVIDALLTKLVIGTDRHINCRMRINETGSMVLFSDGQIDVVYHINPSSKEATPISVAKVTPDATFTHFYRTGRDEVEIDGIRLSIVAQSAKSVIDPSTMLGKLGLNEPDWRVSKLFTAEMVRTIKVATFGNTITAIVFEDVTVCQVYCEKCVSFRFHQKTISDPITVRRSGVQLEGLSSFRCTTRLSYGDLLKIMMPIVNALI